MFRLVLTILLVASIAALNAQQTPVVSQLSNLIDYESRLLFYEESTITIDSLVAVLERSKNDRERVELLLFFLRRQFNYDISIGRKEAEEALKLARSEGLRLHEAMALSNLATIASVYEPSETAHQYADSALLISKEIGDHVLESSIYYTKYVIDLGNEDHVSGVINLLNCVELTEKHASSTVNNRRQISLMTFAMEWNNIGLVERQLNKLNFEELILKDQTTYLIYQGHMQNKKGNSDSARYFYKEAFKLLPNKNTYFELGKCYQRNGELDSAIYLINKSIELKDPRESYFDLRFIALAEIYESKKDFVNAEKYLRRRIDETIRLVEKNNEALGYADLAAFYFRKGSLDSAYEYAERSFLLASEHNYGESIASSTLILSQIAEKQGNAELANSYLKNHLNQIKINNELMVIKLLKKAEIDKLLV